MSNSQELHQLAPRVRLRINGAEVPVQVMADLVTVRVLLDVAAPSMFTLQLVNWDMEQSRCTWSDDGLFALGSILEVQMGYGDQLETLLVGEITGLEMELNGDETPLCIVRGYDRRHRLQRGHKTRTFRQATDSDLASQLADEARLKAAVVDSKVRHPYVLQHNQTDLEFLQERAQRIGYEVLVEDETLLFRPPPITESAALTLNYTGGISSGGDGNVRDGELLECYLRLSSLNTVAAMTVRGWDRKSKEVIVATANAGSERGVMDGAVSGPLVAKGFGQHSAISLNRPIASQAEADQVAQGRFDQMALDYISGEGVCVGRSDLRAGQVIKIGGLGQRFSGRYYVTSAIHTYTEEQGYRTTVAVRRNAA